MIKFIQNYVIVFIESNYVDGRIGIKKVLIDQNSGPA